MVRKNSFNYKTYLNQNLPSLENLFNPKLTCLFQILGITTNNETGFTDSLKKRGEDSKRLQCAVQSDFPFGGGVRVIRALTTNQGKRYYFAVLDKVKILLETSFIQKRSSLSLLY